MSLAEQDQAQRFIPLTLAETEQYWGLIEPLLSKACEHSSGSMTMEKIAEGLKRGVYQVCIVATPDELKAAAVFEVRDHECGSALWIVAAGGHDAASWTENDEDLKAYARGLGCGVVRIKGRTGWVKKLPHWQWVLELSVNGG